MPIVEGLHLGSTIHDVDEIGKTGKWVLMRPSAIDGGVE